jgi:signal transduction histidine kinase
MQYVVLLFLALLQVIISIVLSAKRHYRISKVLIFFSITLLLWTLANSLLDYSVRQVANGANPSQSQLSILNWANVAGFFTGTLTLTLLYRMVRTFPLNREDTQFSRIVTMAGLLVAILALTPAVSGHYVVESDKYVYKYGSIAIILTIYFLFVAVFSLKETVDGLHQTTNIALRKQAKTILASLLITIALALFLITIFPVITHNESYIFLGYYTPYIFTTALLYSILKQQFLDMRRLFTLSVAYLIPLGLLAIVYAYGFIKLGNTIFSTNINGTPKHIYDIAAALLIAFTFPLVKTYFQKVTDRIFYRDHYDPNVLLNNLASTMAREIELQRLTDGVLDELIEQMRLSKASIVVTDKDNIFFEANAGTEHTKYMKEEDLKQFDHGLIVKDMLDLKSAPEIYKEYNIEVSVGLSSNNEFTGYLLLGPKKSGDIFNGTDIKTLRILANELAVAIHNAKSYTQIQNFNKTLQVKIEEATTQLRDANAHLKELDEIKNEFLSMATHQLNTPLAAVDGYLSMMSDGIISDPKEQHETLGKLLHRVRMMKHLVTDFLNVSRIEAGTFVIEPTPVDMNKMVTDQINELGVAAKEKEVFLQFVAPKHPLPPVEVDEQKISQAVMNLIDNAIYYTPKGNVKVYLDSDGQNVIFRVVDNGIGVPEKQKDKLFQKFARADNAKKERPNGNGVGLYLVKLVVEAHGGKIIFESTEGKGSTFGFSIPMKAKEDIEPKIQEPRPKEAVAA